MKLLKFTEFVNEALDTTKLAELGSTIQDINFLLTRGLISDSDAKGKLSKVNKEFFQTVKSSGALTGQRSEDIELLTGLSQISGNECLKALSSDGAKALTAKGLYMVSSITQLVNGTIVWSLDKDYQRSNGWGIGFFPGPRVIRRMTPKGVYLGVYRRPIGSMDVEIKNFNKTTSTGLDFYNKAMLWAAENIDFETAALYPEPTTWKYYKKKKDQKPAMRSEKDDVWAKADDLQSKGITALRKSQNQDSYGFQKASHAPDLIQAYEYLIQGINLKLDWLGDSPDPAHETARDFLTGKLNTYEHEVKKLQQVIGNEIAWIKTTQSKKNNSTE